MVSKPVQSQPFRESVFFILSFYLHDCISTLLVFIIGLAVLNTVPALRRLTCHVTILFYVSWFVDSRTLSLRYGCVSVHCSPGNGSHIKNAVEHAIT